jgi:acetylornithine deacetylase/succinyl-diaminopimelate desuccinylase-like protein
MTISRRHRNERIAAAILIAVLLALVFVFIHWNRSEEDALRRDLRYIPKKETITPEVLLLRDYIRIDTSTAEGSARGARWLAQLLAENGLRAELIESTPGRLNVYVRVRGRKRGGGLLLFNHIDVVPANAAEWKHPPFAGEIHLNQLWGRGAIDMKATALCELFALAAVNREGTPEHDIAFLATAEEEQGSDHGMKWLLAHRPDLFDGIEYAITEGGITEVISETSSYFGIEVGSKQHVQTVLRSKDREALRAAREALEPYMLSRERFRVIPEVRRYFQDIAPSRMAMKPYLADIDAAIARGDAWRLPLSYRDLMQNTMYVTTSWRVDDQWSMWALMLNLPDEDPDARVEWLKAFVAPFGITTVDVTKKEGPVPSSSDTSPLMVMLAGEARAFYRVNAGSEMLYSSVSDCRFVRQRGINCYGVSPFLVDISQSLTIHRADERIRLDWFMNGIEYLTGAMKTWAKRG